MAKRKNGRNNEKKDRLVYFSDKELETLFGNLSVKEIEKLVKIAEKGVEV